MTQTNEVTEQRSKKCTLQSFASRTQSTFRFHVRAITFPSESYTPTGRVHGKLA